MKTPNGTWFPALLVGEGWRLLGPDDVLQTGDETACLGLLVSLTVHRGWRLASNDVLGVTVAAALVTDGDRGERIFRRRTSSIAEDAAKYRAAVERLAHERTAGAEASHWDYAHVILTGDVPADASPVAPQETLDKARVAEVLESHLGPQLVRAILRDLGLALDVGGGK